MKKGILYMVLEKKEFKFSVKFYKMLQIIFKMASSL